MTDILPPADAAAYPAPAKLNLMLKVVGRRADGYHLLETVFCLINLCDTVFLRMRTDGQIVLHNPQVGIDAEDDLTIRAARALQKASGSLKGVDIWLDKKIPTGGGLGGGSSDAATVLLALNHQWQCGLRRQELEKIALTLGADVPFFVFGRNAFAAGIGEELSVLDVPMKHYVVVRPDVQVPTAQIFCHPRLTRNSPRCIVRDLQKSIPMQNDLQNVVLSEFGAVADALHDLQQYGEAMMTGSGSCVFLKADTQQQAERIARNLDGKNQTFCVAGLPQHPLYALCSN